MTPEHPGSGGGRRPRPIPPSSCACQCSGGGEFHLVSGSAGDKQLVVNATERKWTS
jgi:hypothetical protein